MSSEIRKNGAEGFIEWATTEERRTTIDKET
jgi:hypothetical protein